MAVEVTLFAPDWNTIEKECGLFVQNLPFRVSTWTIGLPLQGDTDKIGLVITPLDEQLTEFRNTSWIKGLPEEIPVSDGAIIPVYVESLKLGPFESYVLAEKACDVDTAFDEFLDEEEAVINEGFAECLDDMNRGRDDGMDKDECLKPMKQTQDMRMEGAGFC